MEHKTVDLVCGMQVDPATSKFTLEQGGVRYAFCCAGCLNTFKAGPQRQAAAKGACCCARRQAGG